jgi:hypothetical protein
LAQEASRLTTASNVRLRAGADDGAAVVATVPLGTELVPLDTGGPAAAWLRVRPSSGPDGWLPARLTRRFTPETRIDAVEAIVKDRLTRQGDSFGARVELLDLVERTLPGLTAPEPGGRFALLWLSALDNVAARIPRTQDRNEPYAGWLKAHEGVVFFHEMAGRWQVRQQAVLDLHARHRDTSSADDIVWFAATHGLPGECESFVPCHLSRMNSLDGTYLRLHPAGRHVDESVTRISMGLQSLLAATGAFFDPRKDCAELMSWVTPLEAAVGATRAGARTDALSALGRVRAPCK